MSCVVWKSSLVIETATLLLKTVIKVIFKQESRKKELWTRMRSRKCLQMFTMDFFISPLRESFIEI